MIGSGSLFGEERVMKGRLGHVGVRMLVRLEAVELPCLGLNGVSPGCIILPVLSFLFIIVIFIIIFITYLFLILFVRFVLVDYFDKG